MVNAHKCSSKMKSSSSTTSIGMASTEIFQDTLQQLKNMLLTYDFIHELEENPTFGSTIRSLLKKLVVPDAPSEVLDFLVGFGPLFEQLSFDLLKKFVANRKL